MIKSKKDRGELPEVVDITGGETTQSTLIDNLVASGTINTNGL